MAYLQRNPTSKLFLLNIRQHLMGNPNFQSYKNGFLSIKDKDCHFVFPLAKRNINSYGKGIAHIAEKICVGYHLHSIKLHPGDLVVDCGANVDALYLYLKKSYGDLVSYQGFGIFVFAAKCTK